jgi:hypothetical protein
VNVSITECPSRSRALLKRPVGGGPCREINQLVVPIRVVEIANTPARLCRDKNVIAVREKCGKLQQKLCKPGQDRIESIFPNLLILLVWRRFWQDLVK